MSQRSKSGKSSSKQPPKEPAAPPEAPNRGALRRHGLLGLVALVVLVACGFAASSLFSPGDYRIDGYKVLAEYPHRRDAFTQGLFFHEGFLYEGTGRWGQSFIRKVELETGRVINQRNIGANFFGEGITAFEGRIIQLTWQSKTGFLYDLETFKRLGTFEYDFEQGWGITHDGTRLFISDSTSTLRIFDPNTLTQTGSLKVTRKGRPLPEINELEYIKGEIWANVWQQDFLVRISPETGEVLGEIDLIGLLPEELRNYETDVLNGIAYDPKGDRIFVTGKKWPTLYEIEVVPKN